MKARPHAKAAKLLFHAFSNRLTSPYENREWGGHIPYEMASVNVIVHQEYRITMKTSSRLNLLILVAFLIVAIAYLLYRYTTFAEERQKIYGATMPANHVVATWQL